MDPEDASREPKRAKLGEETAVVPLTNNNNELSLIYVVDDQDEHVTDHGNNWSEFTKATRLYKQLKFKEAEAAVAKKSALRLIDQTDAGLGSIFMDFPNEIWVNGIIRYCSLKMQLVSKFFQQTARPLIATDPDLEALPIHGIFIRAAGSGYINTIELFYLRPEVSDATKKLALDAAISRDHLPVVKSLLLNDFDKHFYIASFYACRKGHVEFVKELMQTSRGKQSDHVRLMAEAARAPLESAKSICLYLLEMFQKANSNEETAVIQQRTNRLVTNFVFPCMEISADELVCTILPKLEGTIDAKLVGSIFYEACCRGAVGVFDYVVRHYKMIALTRMDEGIRNAFSWQQLAILKRIIDLKLIIFDDELLSKAVENQFGEGLEMIRTHGRLNPDLNYQEAFMAILEEDDVKTLKVLSTFPSFDYVAIMSDPDFDNRMRSNHNIYSNNTVLQISLHKIIEDGLEKHKDLLLRLGIWYNQTWLVERLLQLDCDFSKVLIEGGLLHGAAAERTDIIFSQLLQRKEVDFDDLCSKDLKWYAMHHGRAYHFKAILDNCKFEERHANLLIQVLFEQNYKLPISTLNLMADHPKFGSPEQQFAIFRKAMDNKGFGFVAIRVLQKYLATRPAIIDPRYIKHGGVLLELLTMSK